MANVNKWDSEAYEKLNKYRIACEDSISQTIKT